MDSQDERWMRMALLEAEQAAEEGEVPVGAVVVCNGKIVGRGHNMTETLKDVTAHAEMMAITAAANTLGGKYLPNCTLYVTVEPCAMCAGFESYFCSDPSPLHPKTIVESGLLEEECAALMSDFFKAKRK